jgi:hypothetical protein
MWKNMERIYHAIPFNTSSPADGIHIRDGFGKMSGKPSQGASQAGK